MNKLQKFGAGTLLGGAVTSGLYVAMESWLTTDSPESYRSEAVQCARHLGETAMQLSQLPADCERFEATFTSKVTDISYMKGDDETSHSSKTVYYLPSSQSFLEQADKDAESYSDGSRARGAVAMGIFGGLMVGFYATKVSRPQPQPKAAAPERVEQP